MSNAVPQSVFTLDHFQWQSLSDTEENEESPFPTEGIDDECEYEPVKEFAVGEEIEGAAGIKLAIKFKLGEKNFYPGALRLIQLVISIHLFIHAS